MNTIKNQKLKAACLLRVSGKKQKDNYSIPYQADVFIEEIQNGGFEGNISHLKQISEKYQDEHQIRSFRGAPLVYLEDGVSVTSFNEDRSEEFSRMIRDAKNGEYDILFAIKVDRMARDQEQALGIVRILNKENGIRVIIPEDRIDTNDRNWKDEYELRAWLASREGRQIKFRMESGRKRKMKEGKLVGDWAYGYDPITDEKGKWTGFVKKNKEQASWLLAIGTWYAYEGLSTTRIAARLNQQGVPTRRGKKWSRDAVLYKLHNKIYRGRHNRKHLADKYGTDIPDFICPPIFSKELSEAIEKKLAQNRTDLRRAPKRNYLFRNKVSCRNCGGKLYGAARTRSGREELRFYSSSGRKCVDGRPCGAIYENRIINRVIPSIMGLCLRPEVSDRMFKVAKSQEEKIRVRIKCGEIDIKKIKEDLKRNEYGFVNQIISESTAREIKGKLERQLELHEKNIQELRQQLLSEEERKRIKRRLVEWNFTLKDKSSIEFAYQLSRTAVSLLDNLYVDCRRKEVLVSLNIPELSHGAVLSSPLSDKFSKSPTVSRILKKAEVLYQHYKTIPPEGSFAIAQSSYNDSAITNHSVQPVKLRFSIALQEDKS